MKWKLLGIVILVVVLAHALLFSCMMRHGKDEGQDGDEQVVEHDLENDVEQPDFKYDTQQQAGSGQQTAQTAAPVSAGLPPAHYVDGYYEMALAEMPAKLSQEISKCKQGICIDLSNRKILWAKDEKKAGCIASMTKMMTVYLFMKDLKKPGSNLTLETVVPATPEACKTGGHQIYMDPKETFTMEELLKCVLIRSANDCALLMGQFLAGGSEEAFVKRMSDEAKEMGLDSFVFHNAHGLPVKLPDKRRLENMGSPIHLAFLAEQLMDIPEVIKWSSTKHDSIRENSPKFKRFDLDSTNSLLNNAACPGVNGMKTGMTDGAGFCVTTTCERNGRRMVVVAMGCTNSKERDALVRNILNWAYSK
ncbi:MAG: D-alanyl-D-alanine carboxypeptidase [Victivallales bacterium]|nr:D-alanyl-D-alanine carboxypeptidase [Victivallales bacterium]